MTSLEQSGVVIINNGSNLSHVVESIWSSRGQLQLSQEYFASVAIVLESITKLMSC